jgi:hypothetical protein
MGTADLREGAAKAGSRRRLLRERGLGYFINSPASTQTDSTQQAPILRVADLLNSPRDDG